MHSPDRVDITHLAVRWSFDWLISTRWPSGSRRKQPGFPSPSHAAGSGRPPPRPERLVDHPAVSHPERNGENHRGFVGRRPAPADQQQPRAGETQQRLAGRQDPWLLVLDNADDPQVLAGAGMCVAEGRGWLRPVTGQAGMILVTSRDGSPASWGSWPRRHRLQMLPADPAAAVLVDHAGHHPGLGSEDDARLLAVRLGGLPLALKIAGPYLAEAAAIPAAFTGTGVIRSYRQYRDAIQAGDLGTVFPAPGGQLTAEQARGLIGRTWDLTLDLLDARPLPEARRVLRLLASFADAPVPYELLLHPGPLAASAPLRDITGSRLWHALKALDDFGLIDLGTSGQGLAAVPVARLHPLVRDTSRDVLAARLQRAGSRRPGNAENRRPDRP